jgi:tRNA U38,U39,U40 pseudouridine synthase TruA
MQIKPTENIATPEAIQSQLKRAETLRRAL